MQRYLLLTGRSFSMSCSLVLLLIIYVFTAGKLGYLSKGKMFGIAGRSWAATRSRAERTRRNRGVGQHPLRGGGLQRHGW
jgi:hypothetical protein